MPAQILDGRQIAQQMREKLRAARGQLGPQPIRLVSIEIGQNPAAAVYVRNQQRAAAEVGIEMEVRNLPLAATEADLLAAIRELNGRPEVAGVHVPTMNIGYASGVAAALVAMAWIAVRALRIDHPDSPLAKSLYRMAYGVTCFSLATSVVGTILGGVWANDSWGRFWGWDPKENGALLICLAQIALLHARMSGMVRDAGFALWTVVTGAIVVFSWFHTNLLGVGLHAYGFSSELLTGVWVSYTVLGVFFAVGAIDVLLRPKPAPFERAPSGGALAAGR